jgi:hypothetical protein
MLSAYVADAMDRTTSPNTDAPGSVYLKPELQQYIDYDLPLSRQELEEGMLGDPFMGITRLQLSDPQSNLDAAANNFDTPAVNGTLDALDRFHCKPVSVQRVRVESSGMWATEIRFVRKPGTVRDAETITDPDLPLPG